MDELLLTRAIMKDEFRVGFRHPCIARVAELQVFFASGKRTPIMSQRCLVKSEQLWMNRRCQYESANGSFIGESIQPQSRPIISLERTRRVCRPRISKRIATRSDLLSSRSKTASSPEKGPSLTITGSPAL